MRLAIFAKTFPGDVDACLAACAAAGVPSVQFNLSIAGLPTVPDAPVPDAVLAEIRDAAARRGVELAAISGTFNAAHPDAARRRAGVEAFGHLAAAARALDIDVITLCSGSRDADDMWRRHPDNDTPAAWADSRASLRELSRRAADAGVRVAVEPEHSNVVDTADRALEMLAEVDSPALGLVYDAANLLDPDGFDPAAAEASIAADVEKLAPHTLLAHAKELAPGRAPVAPGQGLLPWPFIVGRLRAAGFDGPLVTHGLDAADVPVAVATLSAALAEDRR